MILTDRRPPESLGAVRNSKVVSEKRGERTNPGSSSVFCVLQRGEKSIGKVGLAIFGKMVYNRWQKKKILRGGV